MRRWWRLLRGVREIGQWGEVSYEGEVRYDLVIFDE
jgi:hypothetical protein